MGPEATPLGRSMCYGPSLRETTLTKFVNRIVSSWLLGEKPRDSACSAPTAGAPTAPRTTSSVSSNDDGSNASHATPLGVASHRSVTFEFGVGVKGGVRHNIRYVWIGYYARGRVAR